MAKRSDARLTLQFLGAAQTVTGSKFLVARGEDNILIDCGLFQGLKELRLRNWAPFPIPASKIRAVVLTHAHIDHSGYLPRLVEQGFRGDVYATPGSCDLLKEMLPDAAYLQEEEARYANKRGYSKHKPALPLYTVESAEMALRLLRPTNYGVEVDLLDGISLRFFRAGHILGAATARLTCVLNGVPKYLTDSGDLGRYSRPILRDPESVNQTDWLLLESTYGNRSHPADVEEELARVINETARERGFLLIPAFAVGRTQELIYVIRQLEEKGRIPTLPVHVDSPMAINATDIYCAHPEDHDLAMKQLTENNRSPLCSQQFEIHRTQEQSKAINELPGPRIVISASGMATGGRILHHLRLRLPDPKTTVLLVGFQAEGTRGRALQDGKTEIKLLGEIVAVRAKVRTIDGFSAHADQGEILRWLRGFRRPPQKTFVVHGENEGSRVLAALIESKLKWEVEIPRHGQKVALI
jgi:metallo-beta-lactamase family protein